MNLLVENDKNTKQSSERSKTRNGYLPKKNIQLNQINHINQHKIINYKNTSLRSSLSSGVLDTDKQNNLSTKKLIKVTNSSLPKLTKINRTTHYISINKRLISDLNYQINNTNKKLFRNLFAYKQTINLQQINDYMIYEKTKKSIEDKKKKGIKNSFDFRIPIAYRRMDNHYKKEDLIPIKMKPKINLEDILYTHNSILRKSMSQNICRKYYLKNNIKLIKEKKKS